MSSADSKEIIEELDVLVDRASVDKDFVQYVKINEAVQRSLVLDVELTRKKHESRVGRRLGAARNHSIAGAQMSVLVSPDASGRRFRERRDLVTRRSKLALQWFANLNTLEFILLSCGIFVCLAGIMFESSRNDRRSLIKNQAEFITWLLFIVIVLSFAYYILFFLAEIAPGATAAFFQLWMRLLRRSPDKAKEDYVDDNVELEENPLFATKRLEIANNSALEQQVQVTMGSLREEQEKNKLLRDELYLRKMQEQLLEQQRKSNGAMPQETGMERQRKEFARERTAEQILSRNSRSIKKKNKQAANVIDEDDDEGGGRA
jgi:hypothetical protein